MRYKIILIKIIILMVIISVIYACNTDVTVEEPKITKANAESAKLYVQAMSFADPDYLSVIMTIAFSAAPNITVTQGDVTGIKTTYTDTGYVEITYIINETDFYPPTQTATISGAISIRGTATTVNNGAIIIEDTFDGEIFGNLLDAANNKVSAGKIKWYKNEDGTYFIKYKEEEFTL